MISKFLGQSDVGFSRDARVAEIYNQYHDAIASKTDHMFLFIFVLQWIVGIILALWVSPLAWSVDQSSVHIHVYFATILGGLLVALPAFLILTQPGRVLNRHVNAITQMFFSILLIHLTGGRIETHFHIFGSLAFLAYYRDWRVVLTATAITTADHFLRGAFWSQSVYGVLTATPWRAVEHAGWVIFEDMFLFCSICNGVNELSAIAVKQTQLEKTMSIIEETAEERTAELKVSQNLVLAQQNTLIASAKNAALGEMAGQAAHEINTPLGALLLTAQSMQAKIADDPIDRTFLNQQLNLILVITARIARIINSMRKLAGHGGNEPLADVNIQQLVADTILLCESRFKKGSILFEVLYKEVGNQSLQCRANEVSQVLINFLNNAHDAVRDQADLERRWVRLVVSVTGGRVLFRVEDGGPGISDENCRKLFQASFTTKSLDHGTGFGLPISQKIAERNQGRIFLDSSCPDTAFVLELPQKQSEALVRMIVNG